MANDTINTSILFFLFLHLTGGSRVLNEYLGEMDLCWSCICDPWLHFGETYFDIIIVRDHAKTIGSLYPLVEILFSGLCDLTVITFGDMFRSFLEYGKNEGEKNHTEERHDPRREKKPRLKFNRIRKVFPEKYRGSYSHLKLWTTLVLFGGFLSFLFDILATALQQMYSCWLNWKKF